MARLGKGAELISEAAKAGKARLAEMFSDEAATLAKQRILKTFPVSG